MNTKELSRYSAVRPLRRKLPLSLDAIEITLAALFSLSPFAFALSYAQRTLSFLLAACCEEGKEEIVGSAAETVGSERKERER